MAEFTPPKVYKAKDKYPAEHLNALNSAVADHGTRVSEVEQSVVGKADQSSVDDRLAAKASSVDLNNKEDIAGLGQRLALSKQQPVGLIVGSSTLVGAGIGGSNAYRMRFTTLFEAMLRNTYAPHLRGRRPVSMRPGDVSPAVSGGDGNSTAGMGHGGKFVRPDKPLTFKSEWPTTGLWFGFREGADTGTVTVSINGGEPVSIGAATSGEQRFTGDYKTPVLERGMHTYTIECTGETVIDWHHFYDGDNERGPILLNAAWGGSTLDWHLPKKNRALNDRLGSLQPDFVILMVGANEEGKVTPRESFTSWFDQFNEMVAEQVTVPPWICYVSQSRGAHKPEFDRSIITDNFRRAVADDPVMRSTVLDGEFFWPSDIEMSHKLDIIYTDNVHPNTKGHAALAEMVGSALSLSPRDTEIDPNIMDGADESPDPVELTPVETPPDWRVWASDDFAGEDGLLSDGRDANAALGGTATPWLVDLARSWSISEGNLVQADGDATQSSLFLQPPAAERQEVTFTYRGGEAGKGAWVRLRVPDTSTTSPVEQVGVKMIHKEDGSATLTLEDRSGGKTATRGTGRAVGGDKVTVRAVGSTVSLLVNDAEVASGEVQTATPGHVQVLAFNGGVILDDISVSVSD